MKKLKANEKPAPRVSGGWSGGPVQPVSNRWVYVITLVTAAIVAGACWLIWKT